jgi:hypothetical protein
MRLRVLVVAAMVAAGCGSGQTPWKRIDVDGRFTFQMPAELVQEDVQGVGSLIGRFRSDDMVLNFDFAGPKTEMCDATIQTPKPGYTSEASQTMLFEESKPGPDADLKYFAIVCFPDPTPAGMAEQRNVLVMWARCRSPQEQTAAKQIFQSIQFLRRQ